MNVRPLVLSLLALACSKTANEPPAGPDPVAAVDARKAKPAPSSPPSPTACSHDADCGFDDRCLPSACVGKRAKDVVGCDESAPPPGDCRCVEGVCTLRRHAMASGAAKTGCTKQQECEFDPPTGACKTGVARTLVETEGGYCACAGGTCTPSWVDEVICKTDADCSYLEDPRRPAPASKVPRPKPKVVPCKTGSWDSVCRAGRCAIVVFGC